MTESDGESGAAATFATKFITQGSMSPCFKSLGTQILPHSYNGAAWGCLWLGQLQSTRLFGGRAGGMSWRGRGGVRCLGELREWASWEPCPAVGPLVGRTSAAGPSGPGVGSAGLRGVFLPEGGEGLGQRSGCPGMMLPCPL